MSQILKSFLGVFLVMMLALSGIGILGGFINVLKAQNQYSEMILELEDSNFYAPVIKENFELAEVCGNELNVTLYYPDSRVVTCTSAEQVPDTSEVEMARVELVFYYRIPFLGIEKGNVLSGYAR